MKENSSGNGWIDDWKLDHSWVSSRWAGMYDEWCEWWFLCKTWPRLLLHITGPRLNPSAESRVTNDSPLSPVWQSLFSRWPDKGFGYQVVYWFLCYSRWLRWGTTRPFTNDTAHAFRNQKKAFLCVAPGSLYFFFGLQHVVLAFFHSHLLNV